MDDNNDGHTSRGDPSDDRRHNNTDVLVVVDNDHGVVVGRSRRYSAVAAESPNPACSAVLPVLRQEYFSLFEASAAPALPLFTRGAAAVILVALLVLPGAVQSCRLTAAVLVVIASATNRRAFQQSSSSSSSRRRSSDYHYPNRRHQQQPSVLAIRGGGYSISSTSTNATTTNNNNNNNNHHHRRSRVDVMSSSAAAASGGGNDDRQLYRAYVAVGSNLGNRYDNIRNALRQLARVGEDDDEGDFVRVVKTSFLYETAPMYVTDQPKFLNGAVEVETNLEPRTLLSRLKRIERDLGRYNSTTSAVVRNGPRPIDLDILLYEKKPHPNKKAQNEHPPHRLQLYEPVVVEDDNLTVPHPAMQEREFVLVPLLDAGGPRLMHPRLNATVAGMLRILLRKNHRRDGDGDDNNNNNSPPSLSVARVLPLPRDRVLHLNPRTTIVMGVLNVTPDSFSDGGLYYNDENGADDSAAAVDAAVAHAAAMVRQCTAVGGGSNNGVGALIIDVGGESTRPGAEEVAAEAEIRRTIPVIRAIRDRVSEDVAVSIDTRRAEVARAAVEAGADLVNDVSGGMHDPDMFRTVSELGVPMVIMHSRGTPATMQSMTFRTTTAAASCGRCRAALAERSREAERAGVYRWLQVVDPGIGFAKDLDGNLDLLRNLRSVRAATGNLPLLLGTSRKGFLGELSGVDDPKRRDPGTIASCVTALCLDRLAASVSASSGDTTASDDASLFGGSCTILRVHNVADTKQAVMVMDAILSKGRS